MKTVSKRFLLTIFLVLFSTAVFPLPPDLECPCGWDPNGGTSSGPAPPPGECLPCPVSIDESIMTLLITALVFGIYIIYKNNLKTKSPV